MSTPGIILPKKILRFVELSDIFDFIKEHIHRAEDISLFPLPPHLSPVSLNKTQQPALKIQPLYRIGN
jgi:hypothetical protein